MYMCDCNSNHIVRYGFSNRLSGLPSDLQLPVLTSLTISANSISVISGPALLSCGRLQKLVAENNRIGDNTLA